MEVNTLIILPHNWLIFVIYLFKNTKFLEIEQLCWFIKIGATLKWLATGKQTNLPRFGTLQFCENSVGLKEKKYISQSLWQIWRPDLNVSFFFFLTFFFFHFIYLFFWAADVSNLSRSQSYSVWNMELDLWMNKIQDRTQSWRSLLYKVFYCVQHVFSLYILTSKFIKNWKKNYASKKKIGSLNFTKSNAHRKTNARGSFETYNWFFLA